MQGGIIDKDMPIHVSNVAIVCNECGPTRIGYRFEGDGDKIRVLPQVREGPLMATAATERRACKDAVRERAAQPRSSRSSGSATSCRCRGSRRSC